MSTHGSIAKHVREHKERHPELYCRNVRCLHRAPCPRHELELPDRPTPYTRDAREQQREHR